MGRPLVVVDGANVVGSVPDGWWRDRAGAAARLRDRLAGLSRSGLPDLPPPLDVVLVVEGAARGVASVPGVRVVEAAGSGDDTVVRLVREAAAQRSTVVVTADRELRRRVRAAGAQVRGPHEVRRSGVDRGPADPDRNGGAGPDRADSAGAAT